MNKDKYRYFAALNAREEIIGWVTLETPMTENEGPAAIRAVLLAEDINQCPLCFNAHPHESQVVHIEPANMGR